MNTIRSRKLLSGCSTLPRLHVSALALGPPFMPVKAAPGKQDHHTGWRLARLPASRRASPQTRAGPSTAGHRHTEAAQHGAPENW